MKTGLSFLFHVEIFHIKVNLRVVYAPPPWEKDEPHTEFLPASPLSKRRILTLLGGKMRKEYCLD